MMLLVQKTLLGLWCFYVKEFQLIPRQVNFLPSGQCPPDSIVNHSQVWYRIFFGDPSVAKNQAEENPPISRSIIFSTDRGISQSNTRSSVHQARVLDSHKSVKKGFVDFAARFEFILQELSRSHVNLMLGLLYSGSTFSSLDKVGCINTPCLCYTICFELMMIWLYGPLVLMYVSY
ncbi:hypothetical protein SERLA73DRAFT_191899 [Serpula lacrymans var. lacrymans S7.3]|uniref:Uncharacterized protein n=1 Tax=Serpula lacrymans var. lacrymans (strain S7.3) TaxID=936435 RepID=F8QIJ8_SERL3|nr:hypothetical protein SERLA73DRAFT_191899 [Serpula lacrymans var. lacrymans S7.3]